MPTGTQPASFSTGMATFLSLPSGREYSISSPLFFPSGTTTRGDDHRKLVAGIQATRDVGCSGTAVLEARTSSPHLPRDPSGTVTSNLHRWRAALHVESLDRRHHGVDVLRCNITGVLDTRFPVARVTLYHHDFRPKDRHCDFGHPWDKRRVAAKHELRARVWRKKSSGTMMRTASDWGRASDHVLDEIPVPRRTNDGDPPS